MMKNDEKYLILYLPAFKFLQEFFYLIFFNSNVYVRAKCIHTHMNACVLYIKYANADT